MKIIPKDKHKRIMDEYFANRYMSEMTLGACNQIKDHALITNSFTVYGTHYKKGYPYFTIFKDNQWITKSAKHFVALEE